MSRDTHYSQERKTMPKSSTNFSYLFKKEKQPNDNSLAPKVLFFVLAFFLILFAKYAPYGNPPVDNPSILHSIFGLYFFVAHQTFGIVHEAGHGVCYVLPCPQFFTVLNGTLFQIGAPLGVAYYYKRQMNDLAMWIGVYFAGFTMHSSAWYISTAHEGAILPAEKSFLGVDAYHDFHYLLSAIGLLEYDSFIALLVRLSAYGLMCYSLWKIFFLAFGSNSPSK